MGCFFYGFYMPKVINTYTNEQGEVINEYESGAVYNVSRGRLAKPAAATVIRSREKATEYNRKRQEKTAARLRQGITAAAAAVLPDPVGDSAEAFAAAGAMLFEQIVLNSEAYPRDRMEAFEKLGKYAGTLPADLRQTADADGGTAAAAGAAAGATAAAAVLARVFADVARMQEAADVVDGVTADGTPPPPMLTDAAAAQPPADEADDR